MIVETDLEKEQKRIRILTETAYFVINKNFLKKIGIHGSLLLCDIVSKYEYFKERGMLTKDGFFFNTRENMSHDTTLSVNTIKKILEQLAELHLIDLEIHEKKATYLRINPQEIRKIRDTEDAAFSKIFDQNEDKVCIKNEIQPVSNLICNKNKRNNNNKVEKLPVGKLGDKSPTSLFESQSNDIPLENIRVFEWVKALLDEYDKDTHYFQIPKRADTKRISKIVSYLEQLKEGSFIENDFKEAFIENMKIDLTRLNEVKGMDPIEIKTLVEKAVKNYITARSNKEFFFPGNRRENISIDEFLFNNNNKVEAYGKSYFVYFLFNDPSANSFKSQFSEETIKECIDFMEDLFDKNYLSWSETDKGVFFKNYTVLKNWYFKNNDLLRKGLNFKYECGNWERFLSKIVSWKKDGGWFQPPHLPQPYEDNPRFRDFRDWLSVNYNCEILYEEPKDKEKPKETAFEDLPDYLKYDMFELDLMEAAKLQK